MQEFLPSSTIAEEKNQARCVALVLTARFVDGGFTWRRDRLMTRLQPPGLTLVWRPFLIYFGNFGSRARRHSH